MDELDRREMSDLENAIDLADNILFKKYIANLTAFRIIPPSDELTAKKVSEITRLIKIDSLAYDKNEDTLKKMSSVYHALSSINSSLIVLIVSDGERAHFYLGTKAKANTVVLSQSVLTKSLLGNFPGTEIQQLRNNTVDAIIEKVFCTEIDNRQKAVTAITGISSIRTGSDRAKTTEFVQGIEKVIETMQGENYCLMIIADPISRDQIENVRAGYENIYSQLSPFASTELNISTNNSHTITESFTTGVSKTISENLSRTRSYTEGWGTNSSTSKNSSKNVNIIFAGVTTGKSKNEGTSHNAGVTDSENIGTGTSSTHTDQSGTASASTHGNAQGMALKYENKSVTTLLEKIDEQLARLKDCETLGMWNCSAYAIADDIQTTKVLASSYLSLMRGDKSASESAAVNTWLDRSDAHEACQYLKKFQHPLIDINKGDSGLPYVTPTSLLSGMELVLQAGLPQKSIPGIPVIEYASFGREVVAEPGPAGLDLTIGKISHMGKEERIDAKLNVHEFAAHTFITGATGSGKSNAIYKILSELSRHKVKFMVVEPAKGEYKNILGNRTDVNVFGTNPSITQLIKINPFKFPLGIHVLEHIDRLVEIFNVCWPMYAAMPAVLKEAIEAAYVSSGWDLDSSTNLYDERLFPSFADVLNELDHVITSSAYSEELKSNYRGALCTRIKSLTNGLNGRIFCDDEIDNQVLFDNNVIIDLSRIGSMETKSMVMGILIMRLQEYRMSQGGINQPLKHITVIEEAHNLLKRTSTEQLSESSNLIGKSVEMLTNAIAEMRTYGEGFIVADQSPGLLDLGVIRNTKTKIIFRLPEVSDRESVGGASGLNSAQIVELTKLKTGNAVIYQNGWMQPILCKIEKYESDGRLYQMPNEVKNNNSEDADRNDLIRFILKDHLRRSVEYETDSLKERIICSKMSSASKTRLLDHITNNTAISFNEASSIITKLVNVGPSVNRSVDADDFLEWNYLVLSNLGGHVRLLEPIYQNALLQCILSEMAKINDEQKNFYFNWVDFMKGTA